MSIIANANKVGIAVATNATSPTFIFQNTAPVALQVAPRHTLYEETGLSKSSYSGLFVEEGSVGTVTVDSYLTPTLFTKVLVELLGLGYAETGTGNSIVATYSPTGSTGVPTIPSYTVGRDFSMFFSDGSTGTPIRCKGNLFSATITADSGGMLMISMLFGISAPTSSSITFGSTFNEATPNDRYATAATTFTIANSTFSSTDVDSWNVVVDTGISELKAKTSNEFRMEGGSRSAMLNIESTFATSLRDYWRSSNPAAETITVSVNNPVAGKPSLSLVMNNAVLSERGVNAPLNEVQTESATWTSAPLSVTGALTNFSSANTPVRT